MKIQNIQALRGIAVLFVVFFHLYIVEKKYSAFTTILPDVIQVGGFGVDIFFIISGFIMITVTQGEFQNWKQSLKFLGNRLTRIYPLYWVYTLLALVVFIIQPTWVNNVEGNQVNILESFLLFPSDKRLLVQVGWTLIHEIYFYLIYFFIVRFFSEKSLLKVLLGWGGLIILLNLVIRIYTPLIKIIISPLTIEFISGCILAIFYYRAKEPSIKLSNFHLIVIIAFFTVIFAYYLFYILTYLVYPPGWWRLILFGIPAFCIVYGLVNAEKQGFVIHGILSKIGDSSYSIYLSHLFTINVLGRLWALISVEHWIDNVIFILLTLSAVLIVGFLSYELIEKRLIRFSRRIINL